MLSSRSSRYFLMYGAFIRAVTFQSMLRISSPGSYSRTSSKSSPEPRKTLRYVPMSAASARIRALISTCLTSRRTSGGTCPRCAAVAGLTLRDRYVVEDATDDDLGCDLLRLSLVGHDEPVPHDIQRDRLDVVGKDVIPAIEERVRSRRERDVDGGARRDAVGDQRLEIGELRPLRITRRDDDADHVVLDRFVHVNLPNGGPSVEDRRRGGELPPDGRLLDRVAVHDHPLLVGRRVTDDDLHHETVDLRFGEAVGALVLDRVLGREHREEL